MSVASISFSLNIASQKYAESHFQIRGPGSKFQSIYGEVGKLFPRHLGHFKEMLKRSKKYSRECDFDRSASGFLLFVEHIGPYPEDMIRPTVGRKDHSKGYVYGNFEWQTLEENNREQVDRKRAGGK